MTERRHLPRAQEVVLIDAVQKPLFSGGVRSFYGTIKASTGGGLGSPDALKRRSAAIIPHRHNPRQPYSYLSTHIHITKTVCVRGSIHLHSEAPLKAEGRETSDRKDKYLHRCQSLCFLFLSAERPEWSEVTWAGTSETRLMARHEHSLSTSPASRVYQEVFVCSTACMTVWQTSTQTTRNDVNWTESLKATVSYKDARSLQRVRFCCYSSHFVASFWKLDSFWTTIRRELCFKSKRICVRHYSFSKKLDRKNFYRLFTDYLSRSHFEFSHFQVDLAHTGMWSAPRVCTRPTSVFFIYAPPGACFKKNYISFYADDTQLYLPLKIGASDALGSLLDCLRDIKAWMALSFLKMNKNETVWTDPFMSSSFNLNSLLKRAL